MAGVGLTVSVALLCGTHGALRSTGFSLPGVYVFSAEHILLCKPPVACQALETTFPLLTLQSILCPAVDS